jgi:hypothetical protein
MREIENETWKIMYLNSGDWIENLTALEYINGNWTIYKFDEVAEEQMKAIEVVEEEMDNSTLFDNMVEEFNLMRN